MAGVLITGKITGYLYDGTNGAALTASPGGVTYTGGQLYLTFGMLLISPGQYVTVTGDGSVSFGDGTNYIEVGTAPTYTQTGVNRTLNAGFVPSTTRNTEVQYAVDIAATLSLAGGQTGAVFLEISEDGATGWTEISRATNGNTGTLTLGLNITQTVTGVVTGSIPAGYSARLRTSNVAGAPTFTYRSGQEATTI